MDELSALPPENSWKRLSRQQRYASPSTARTESISPLHHVAQGQQHPQRPLSVNTFVAQSDSPTILAPTPRRHLIESSASQHWLHTPPLSPPSSRPASPFSQQQAQSSGLLHAGAQPFPQSSSSSSSLYAPPSPIKARRRRISSQTQAHAMQPKRFNELLELDQAAGGQRRPKGLPRISSSSSLRAEAGNGGSVRGGGIHAPPEIEETSMGRRYIRWMHKHGMRQWVVPAILGTATMVKLMIGLGSYSGASTPPMFGDYEAQRHWMEITTHLPFKKWYTYDLPYWGLDYPPLTAYISWICGIVAHRINPSWVELDASRGIETSESKVFMRQTVLVSDALVYLPALWFFARTWQGSRSKRTQELALLTLALQPALLLIDFGHFQYNSVMLGFTLLAINFFATEQDSLGAFFFVLSLGFKQMALYYAPPIGSYLLAKCLYLGPTEGSRLFVRLAVVTVSTFFLLFLPWLPPFAPLSGILQPVIRIFPFARGLFEDKVANFWCASNVIFKWKTWASSGVLVKLSTLLTALGFLPAVVGLLQAGWKLSSASISNRKPTPFLPLLPYALLTSSMSFFLFSFQVHEKTILLPLMPMTLLLSGANVDSAVYNWGVLANNIAVFSMWPLLKRDGLGVQYIATLFLWNRLIGYNPVRLPRSFVQFISLAVYAAATAVHVLELVVDPPKRYPDLYPVLNVLISTPVFVLVWLWSIKCGVEVGWALGGLGKRHTGREASEDASSVSGNVSPVTNGDSSSFRQLGGRSASLGYGQAKRRTVAGSSVGGEESVVNLAM